jgi:uncharacterized sulfatase
MFASEQGTQVPFAKWTCYDAGLKAAFIVRWPGHVKPGTRTAAMAEYVDILPTVLEAAGADPGKSKAPFDGRSFLHVLKDGSRPHKNHVFGVQTTRGIIQGSECYPVRSIRTAKYKYIRNLNSKDEFKNVITGQKNGLIESWIARGGSAEQRARAYLRRPPEELYDIGADPYELRNLAGDPAHARTLRSLSSQLTSWMKSQGDEGIATEMQAKSRQAGGQE